MKIVLLTTGIVNYDCNINFFEPLKDLGHDVINYDYLHRIGGASLNRELKTLVDSEKPDYIFYITHQNEISPENLQDWREKGFRVVGFFPDDDWRFENYSKFKAKEFFCSVTFSYGAINKYKANNLRVIQGHWGANPKYYFPIPSLNSYDVSFVGRRYAVRENFIIPLRQAGISVHGFGRNWKSGYIPFKDLVSIFSNSRINLNFNISMVDSKIKEIKARVVEVPMCGGFLLTSYAEGLEEYFRIGEEIICFTSLQDLISKVKYYLENDEERKKIAAAGYKAALERHTWQREFSYILKELEGID